MQNGLQSFGRIAHFLVSTHSDALDELLYVYKLPRLLRVSTKAYKLIYFAFLNANVVLEDLCPLPSPSDFMKLNYANQSYNVSLNECNIHIGDDWQHIGGEWQLKLTVPPIASNVINGLSQLQVGHDLLSPAKSYGCSWRIGQRVDPLHGLCCRIAVIYPKDWGTRFYLFHADDLGFVAQAIMTDSVRGPWLWVRSSLGFGNDGPIKTWEVRGN